MNVLACAWAAGAENCDFKRLSVLRATLKHSDCCSSQCPTRELDVSNSMVDSEGTAHGVPHVCPMQTLTEGLDVVRLEDGGM